ncbi:MAG: RHS repeat-associated core domain-containing protein [Ignavibacteriaceae bacterium]
MNTLNLFSVEISSPLFTETLTYETGGYGGVGYYHGNIASASFSYYSGGPAAYQTLYQYDNLGRLKIADNNITALNPYDISNISYDLNGNIISINRGGTNYTYNYYTGTNKLKNTGGSNNDYEYDLNGNIKKSLPKGLDPLVYDPFTQMTKSITVTRTPNKMMSFQYSADNERILKNEKQGTTNNLNLYIRGASEYPVIEKINTNNTLTDKVYIYGPTGLIAFKDATATYFVIKDHLGSTRVLFRSTGTQYATYDYSPFGSLMRATINGDVVYKFTGQEYDSEFGLYNFRARLYDDELGIFYAVDPSGQNFSPFSYAGNNPVIRVDRDGRIWWIPLLIGFSTGYLSHALTYDDWGWGAIGQGLISGSMSFVGWGVTSALSPYFSSTLGLSQGLSTTLAGGLSGGITSSLFTPWVGGNFGTNFLSGFVGGALGGAAQLGASSLSISSDIQFGLRVVGGGISGGLTSSVFGGTFMQGFAGGAMGAAMSGVAAEIIDEVYSGKMTIEEAKKILGITDEEWAALEYANGEYPEGTYPELTREIGTEELWAKLQQLQQNEMIGPRTTSQSLGNFQLGVETLRFGGDLHVRYQSGTISFHRDLISIVRNPILHLWDDYKHPYSVPAIIRGR